MKEWQKPQLIVLVRSKPEEMVLAACKYLDSLSGPDAAFGYCGTGPGCSGCAVNSDS
jgi:hypothetical protein